MDALMKVLAVWSPAAVLVAAAALVEIALAACRPGPRRRGKESRHRRVRLSRSGSHGGRPASNKGT